jgi:hypothetical protein
MEIMALTGDENRATKAELLLHSEKSGIKPCISFQSDPSRSDAIAAYSATRKPIARRAFRSDPAGRADPTARSSPTFWRFRDTWDGR